MTSETRLPDNKQSDLSPVPTLSAARDRKVTDANLSVSDHAHLLCQFGLSDRSLEELEELPSRIQNWSRRLHSLQQSKAFQRIFGDNDQHRIKNIEWLAGFHRKPILEPQRFALYAHPNHASPQAPTLYRSAKKHHKRLQQKLTPHREYIDLDDLPEFSRALEALDILTGVKESRPFSRVRREAQEMIADAMLEENSLKSPEIRTRLGELRELFVEMAEFRHSAVYKEFLGPSFKGYHSNWAELKSFIKFSQAIHYSCADNRVARQLLANWESRRKYFMAASAKAASVIKEMHKLTKLTGLILQTKTCNPRLSTIQKNAAIAESEIRQHLSFLCSEVNDNTLTPKTIIQMNLG